MHNSPLIGHWYKEGETVLSKQIQEVFEAERGPGATPVLGNQKILGVISPYGPYDSVGPCMAWSHKALVEAGTPDVFVIVTANHHSMQTCTSQETHETPFGLIRVDQALARELVMKGHIEENPEVVAKEEAIDAQLPFLQYSFKEKAKILPLVISADANFAELAVDLKELLMEQQKKAVFIIATNFTRYGSKYHYAPFVSEVKKNVYETDQTFITLLTQASPDELVAHANKNLLTIDGIQALRFFLQYTTPQEAALEQYYATADLDGNWKESTSYAAIILK